MLSKSKSKIHILTSANYPEGNEDLRALCGAVREHGVECGFLLWGESGVREGDMLLALGVWDYAKDYKKFLTWLEEMQILGARILNPLLTIKNNIDKRYLLELEQRGIPIVPSEFVESRDLAKKDLAWKVIKPPVGQSGVGVERGERVEPLAYPLGAIVQPFIPSIQERGEVCLVFFGGEFRYSILRKPKEWRANSSYGVSVSAITPQKEWIELGERALEGVEYLYARVDIFIEPLLVSEVELIEPALYFFAHQGAMQEFVGCLIQRFVQKC